MKTFLLKCGLFAAPIFILLFPAFLYLNATGELLTHAGIVRENQDKAALVGLAYSDPIQQLKPRIVARRKSSAVVVGTSRVLQMREFFFKDPESFYNCGRTVHKIGDFRPFLESLPAPPPPVLLLGLDQNFFNENWDDLSGPRIDHHKPDPAAGRKFAVRSREFLKDFFRGRIDFTPSHESPPHYVGLTARLHGDGYRADGSYRYARILRTPAPPPAEAFRKTIDRVREREGRFRPAPGINPAALEELEEICKACRNMGIHIVAFLPPFAHAVYEEFTGRRDQFPHVFELEAALQPILARHGFSLFDFADNSTFGSNDRETIDGYHPSETAVLRMIIAMSRKDERLRALTDPASLEQLLRNAHSPRQVIHELDEPPAPGD